VGLCVWQTGRLADWQLAFEEVETEMPGIKGRKELMNTVHENHKEGVEAKETITDKDTGIGRALGASRNAVFRGHIFLTFCCYPALPKEG
jgi:hypothetical protein